MSTEFPLSDLPAWAIALIVVAAATQLALQVYALVNLSRTPIERLQFGKKWPWALVIILGEIVGAIIYLVISKKPAAAVDPLAAEKQLPATADRAQRAADLLYGSDAPESEGGER